MSNNWQQLIDEIGLKAKLRAKPGRVDLAAGYVDDNELGRLSKGKTAVRGPNSYAEQSYSAGKHIKVASGIHIERR